MALRLQSSPSSSNSSTSSNDTSRNDIKAKSVTSGLFPLRLLSQEQPQSQQQQQQQQQPSPPSSFIAAFLPSAPALGAVGAAVALTSLLWSSFARPDVVAATSASRMDHFIEYVSTDRLAYAFTFDIVLYALCQAVLIGNYLAASGGAAGEGGIRSVRGLLSWLRFVPCFGLAAFLVLLPTLSSEDGGDV